MLLAVPSVRQVLPPVRAGCDRFDASRVGDIKPQCGHWRPTGGVLEVDEPAVLADPIHGTALSSYLLFCKDFSTLLMSSDAGIWSPPAIRRINASEGCRSPRSSLPK